MLVTVNHSHKVKQGSITAAFTTKASGLLECEPKNVSDAYGTAHTKKPQTTHVHVEFLRTYIYIDS